MFELGQTYRFTTTDGRSETHWNGAVQSIDGNLLSLQTLDGDVIFNTASSQFKSASLLRQDQGRVGSMEIFDSI